MKNKIIALMGFCFFMGSQVMADWTTEKPSNFIPTLVEDINEISADACTNEEFLKYLNGGTLTADSCGRVGIANFLFAMCGGVTAFENTQCGKNAIAILPKSAHTMWTRPRESDVITFLTEAITDPAKIDLKYVICKINDEHKQRTLKKVTDKPEVIAFCDQYEAKRAK